MHQFIKAWVVTSSDGYTSKPVAYFSSKDQAQVWMKSATGASWLRLTGTVEAIQVGNKSWLLGDPIDVDCAEAREKEKLANTAKSKLSPEELAAILGK